MSPHLELNFLEDKTRYWRKGFRGKNEPIAKALGSGRSLLIWDLTAGLAVDSLTMVRLGHRVEAFERSSEVYQALAKAHEEALASDQFRSNFERIRFHHKNAIEFLMSEAADWPKPDVIYIDPMFSEEKRKAKPKADMQVLRELVGSDEDALELFELAVRLNAKRCVVKMAPRSQPLKSKPQHQIEAKAFRFDIYYQA